MGRWVILVAVSVGLTSCFGFLHAPEPAWPTVDGPESPTILAESHGYVLSVEGGGTLEILRLRDGRVTKHHASWWRRIWQLEGPDCEGRILYVKEGSSTCDLMLTTVEGGEAARVLSRKGEGPFWEQRVFSGLALSPAGGRFALTVFGGDDSRPSGIEIWNLDGPRLEQTLPIEGYPSWSKEGRLLVQKRVARDEVPPEMPHGPDEALWINRVDWPVWYELDTSTGATKPLVISFDSPDSAVPDLGRVPGLVHPVGRLDGELFVYRGYPTAGTRQKLQYTLQKAPERMLSLKVANCRTGEFVTVMPYVGRFHSIRCGDVDPGGE